MHINDYLNLSQKKKLPVIFSTESAECGLVCLAMIGRYYGHKIDISGLRQKFSVSLSGLTLRSIMDMAEQLSFTTRPLQVEIDLLKNLRLPAILHWDLNHFVVLKSVSRDAVIIHDPVYGARRISSSELSRHYTGVALEIWPAESFVQVKISTPIGLSSLWSNSNGFWHATAQILLLSVALQIAAFAAPFQIQLVTDQAVGHSDTELLTVIALGFGGLVVIQASVDALRSWALQILGNQLNFQMVSNLVHHLLRLPADFFEKRHVGDILSRINSTSSIQDALTRGIISALIDGTMALIAVIILFFYSSLLAGVVLAAMFLNLVVAFAFYPAMRMRTEEQLIASANERSHLMESIRAAVTIKVMGREHEREAAWSNLYGEVVNTSISLAKFQVNVTLIQSIISGIQTVFVIYLGAHAILTGAGFSIGMLMAFLSFRQTFTDRISSLINQAVQFRLLKLYVDRLADIVTALPDSVTRIPDQIGGTGELRFSSVEFRYGMSDPVVLRDVDLAIEPGEFVAITGPSGGGKSTLFKLMLGLQTPTNGEILLGDELATPELWRSWRLACGVVSQDDKLLSGSIADNIAFFDPELDMGEVQVAAKLAQIDADIQRMPMRYMSLIGDMGSSLSGGQKQRLLLARALYRNPRALFLDEGTANLDRETEEMIADVVSALPITRVVVAHRRALIRRASRVLVVSGGHVHEPQARKSADLNGAPDFALSS